MKNITVSVGGVNVAFDEDGTMHYISMKVVNMDEEHRWQEVYTPISFVAICVEAGRIVGGSIKAP